jgi:hypothetical protein
MPQTVYFETTDDKVLAICVAGHVKGAPVVLKQVASAQKLPAGVGVPLPSAGLPVVVLPDGGSIQDCSAAVKMIGAHVQRSAHGC